MPIRPGVPPRGVGLPPGPPPGTRMPLLPVRPGVPPAGTKTVPFLVKSNFLKCDHFLFLKSGIISEKRFESPPPHLVEEPRPLSGERSQTLGQG